MSTAVIWRFRGVPVALPMTSLTSTGPRTRGARAGHLRACCSMSLTHPAQKSTLRRLCSAPSRSLREKPPEVANLDAFWVCLCMQATLCGLPYLDTDAICRSTAHIWCTGLLHTLLGQQPPIVGSRVGEGRLPADIIPSVSISSQPGGCRACRGHSQMALEVTCQARTPIRSF